MKKYHRELSGICNTASMIRQFAIAATSVFLLLLSSCNNTHQRAVSDELREQSVAVLQYVLHHGEKWEKVHAAEFLLELSYPYEVYDVFKNELNENGHLPEYRIGIWRVLFRCADKNERPAWQDSIYRVFIDESSPDRVHAAETLAKLRIPFQTSESEMVISAIKSGDQRLSFYTSWWAYTQSESNPNDLKDTLLHIIHAPLNDYSIKRLAAYVLKEDKAIRFTAKEWTLLKDITLSEPEDSELKPFLAVATFTTVPPDSLYSESFSTIKTLLLQYTSSNSQVVYQLCTALAEKGNPDDLYLLSTIAERPENDIKNVVSYATLRIERRLPYEIAWQDIAVNILYLTRMIMIGVYYSRRNKTVKDYIFGGGNMSAAVVGVSLFATMYSSLSYLAYPGEMIQFGPVIFAGMLAFPITHWVVGWLIIPRFMKYNVNSAYELLEIKLGKGARMLATFFFLSLRFLWMATIMYVTVEVILRNLLNFPAEYSMLISALLIVVTFVYTALGGLKASVLTDVVQSGLMWGGALLTIIIVSVKMGSFGSILPDHWLSNWSELKWGFNPKERLTVANACLMLFVWNVCTAGSDQMAIQRYMATKNVRVARQSFGISLLSNLIVKIFLGLVGLAMLAFFAGNPHFLSDGETLMTQADALFPRFVLIGLPAGISGIVIAALLAAAMSSLSSGLNSTASVISVDIIKRFFNPNQSPEVQIKQMRFLSMIIGVGIFVLSLFVSQVEGNLFDVVIKVVNLFVAPLFVLFFMALYVPFATSSGTCIGGLASIGFAISIAFFQFMGISVLWIMPAALIAGVLTGIIASFIHNRLFQFR